MRTANENGKVVAYLEGMVNSTNAPQVQQALREALAANPESMLEIDAGAQVRTTHDGPVVDGAISRAGRLVFAVEPCPVVITTASASVEGSVSCLPTGSLFH